MYFNIAVEAHTNIPRYGVSYPILKIQVPKLVRIEWGKILWYFGLCVYAMSIVTAAVRLSRIINKQT